jgi:hypothetical protein
MTRSSFATPPPRASRSFPTRYAGLVPARDGYVLEAGRLYRFVLGLDDAPRPMTPAETAQWLNDPLATLVLRRGILPQTLDELLAQLDRFNADPEGVPVQASYLVGDGSQIPWTPESGGLDRRLRFAITRAAAGGDVALLVSTGLVTDSADMFLQVLAWDPVSHVYNYYLRQKPAWVWSGNSIHALAPETRGQGPFDSHVNGSLVMKELKPPWNNWQSVRAHVDSALAPDDPVRRQPLFRDRKNAEVFQISVVQPGISRWNRARLAKSLGPDRMVSDVPYFMRQVLETTTVNLASSDAESRLVRPDDRVPLPITFFLNSDALINTLELEPAISPPAVEGRWYLDSLRRYDFALVDEGFREPGDTYFAFLVPEPAFEDVDVLRKLLEAGVVTARFAASLLMVDFPNPIYSERRRQLMTYVPATARVTDAGSDLPGTMGAAIADAARALPADSPEREFLAWWGVPEDRWRAEFTIRIERYVAAIVERLAAPAGFDDYVRLAESRRREYRRQPLNEFLLTLPTTNIPTDSAPLRMNEDGTVGAKRP